MKDRGEKNFIKLPEFAAKLYDKMMSLPPMEIQRAQIAQEYKIDLILQGHRHVPHVWRLGDSILLYCGTSTSDKVRGDDPPCFNQISLNKDKLEVYIVDSNSLKKKLLLSQAKDKINYVRQRNNKINHIINSNVFQTII